MRKQMYYRLLLAGILLFSLLTKILFIANPPKQYFDEIYHGFTATQYLHNNPDAYDPWATPPEGKAFEWTHPPLAKLIMAATMAVVGENSFGWRFSSALFGTGAVLMTSLVAYELFRSRRVALAAAALFSMDGLLLTQSRIAMNDTHFLFFMLTAFWLYLKWRSIPEYIEHKKRNKVKTHPRTALLFASGISLGLSVASKWTAVYALAAIGIDRYAFWTRNIVKDRRWVQIKEIVLLSVAFLAVPTAVYFLSYTQYFALGFNWDQFVELQKQMLWYHTKLVATHTYQSRPWQWVLNLRPVWMHVDYAHWPEKVGYIYNLGNSVIFYGGFLAVLALIYKLLKQWNWSFWFVALAYIVLFLPWTFSPRIMFFYHYLPSVSMLTIALGYFVGQFTRKKSLRVFGFGILALALIWFVAFYPYNTGLLVPKTFADTVYRAIPSWK